LCSIDGNANPAEPPSSCYSEQNNMCVSAERSFIRLIS
jgi:hypothetical protein